MKKRRNKARMYMKTKEKYKMSWGLVAQTAGSAVCGFSPGRAADRKYGGPRYWDYEIAGTKPECV